MGLRQMGHLRCLPCYCNARAQSEHMHKCRQGITVVSRGFSRQITHSEPSGSSSSPSDLVGGWAIQTYDVTVSRKCSVGSAISMRGIVQWRESYLRSGHHDISADADSTSALRFPTWQQPTPSQFEMFATKPRLHQSAGGCGLPTLDTGMANYRYLFWNAM